MSLAASIYCLDTISPDFAPKLSGHYPLPRSVKDSNSSSDGLTVKNPLRITPKARATSCTVKGAKLVEAAHVHYPF